MKYLLPLRSLHLVLFIAASYFVFVGYDALHETGWVQATKKNGDGCTCHGDHVPTDSVLVWIEGPDSVRLSDVVVYTIVIKGGPAVGGGFNVATSAGALAAFDSTSQVVSGELTQTAAKLFTNDSVTWKFLYQAPTTGQTDTIFGVGNSVNLDGIPFGDQYNFTADFVVHLRDTTTGVGDEYQPLSFHLYQNYPNPFNPVTKVSFVIGYSSFVSLKVYNVLGTEIATLFNGYKPVGRYDISYDASSLSSGIYFYTLRAGHSAQTKKMLLIR